MKIEKSSGGKFTPHIEGNFRAVCVDVTPLQRRETQYGTKEEFRLVFETDAPETEKGPACVWTRGFTPSLNEKASFRKFIRQWFGRDLTEAEEDSFDTEDLIGRAANLVITHSTGDGDKVYANIVACVPCKENPLAPSGDFVRKQDRKEEGEGAAHRHMAAPTGGTAKNQPVDATQAGSDWTKVKVHVGKHNGVEVRDLDQTAIEALVNKWLPEHKRNPKPTADDKRLAAALVQAEAAIQAANQAEY